MMSPNRRRLEAVSGEDTPRNHQAPTEFDSGDGSDDGRAQTVIRRWAPEHQLIGALMHLPASQARPILQTVPDTAIWSPMSRWAYELIRGLVDAGRDPDPVLVLRAGKAQPAADALRPNQPVTPGRYHELAVYLANAYTQVVDPRGARHYAQEVLDDAYRRAVHEYGIRLAQMAKNGAEQAVVCKEALKLARLVEQWIVVSQSDVP